MNPEQIKQEQERVNKLLEGATAGEWVIVSLEPARIKTGAGIIEVNGSHSYADFYLMAAAPDIARAYLALLDAHLALHAQLAQVEGREARLREAARNVMVMASPHFSDGTQLLALRELSDALAQAGKG